MTALKRRTVWSLLLTAGILTFLILIFAVNIYHINYAMNSDIAAEAILGELIWNKKQLIPDSWYVSTEARIISTPNLAALFNGLTHNMALSLGLSCCCMTVLTVASLFYCTGAFRWKLNRRLAMVLLVLLIPGSISSLEVFYLFSCYYSIHLIILFLTLRSFLDLTEGRKGWQVRAGISCAWALLIGLQGVRGLLVIYGPLLVIQILKSLYRKIVLKSFERKEAVALLWSLLLTVCSYAGTLFPYSVGQSFSRNIREGLHKLLYTVIPDMGRSIGIGYFGVPGTLCIAVFLGAAGFCLCMIIRKMLKKEKVTEIEWIFLLMLLSPLMTAAMISFTTIDSSERYYFLLILALALGAVIFADYAAKQLIYGVCLAALLLGTVNIRGIYLPMILNDDSMNSDLMSAVNYLEENGYETAYATFDYANTMTMLSNGRVRVYAVNSMDELDMCKWLTDREGYPPYTAVNKKTAYIVTQAHMDEINCLMQENSGMIQQADEFGALSIYVSQYNFADAGNQ